ncbi:MAG TPA: hypothetical protein VFA15_07820 [Nitrososphaera sp.]|nr:hypothetical protein [Nitrososphaera sp.]
MAWSVTEVEANASRRIFSVKLQSREARFAGGSPGQVRNFGLLFVGWATDNAASPITINE